MATHSSLKLDLNLWESVKREDHMPSAKNEYAYSFIDLCEEVKYDRT